MYLNDLFYLTQRISSKNAFGLHLIDYMSELFKKKDITDFQVEHIYIIYA